MAKKRPSLRVRVTQELKDIYAMDMQAGIEVAEECIGVLDVALLAQKAAALFDVIGKE